MSELRGLGDVHRKLAAAGGGVLAVSTDKIDDSRRAKEKHKIPFDLLCDTDATVVEKYGLKMHDDFQDMTMAIPANFLIDKSGKLAWRHVAHRVNDRVDPAEIETAIDRL